MYRMNPRRLYAMEWALRDERNVRRMESLLRGLGRDASEVVVLRDEDLPQAIRDSGWIGEVRQGAYQEPHDPDFLFTAFRWVSPEERSQMAGTDLFRECVKAHITYGDCNQGYLGGRVVAMMGGAPFYHYERRPDWDPALTCWSLHDLHSAWGCVHRCAYCQRGSVYVVNLNLEEFVEHVDQLLAENPWQKTWRYDVEQDVLPIEPEYGACEMLVNDFARRDGRYLILFSKSANVDHLLPLDHRGHTMMLWTLEQRIAAARKCQDAGYPVRFKCKPVIPIRDWRAETTEMFETLYANVRPENISIETVFFSSVAEMDATVGLDSLDPEFVAAAREAEAEAAAAGKWPRHLHGERPFPFTVKEAIYRHMITESRRISPETPVTLCAETARMWEALADILDYKPWDYVCNCGPQCPPGLERLTCVEGPDAARVEQARSEVGVME